MNRRQRRAEGERHQPRITGADLKSAVACPDCNSDLEPVEVAPGRYVIEVRHDDSCPWFRKFQRNGGYGVRIVTRPTAGEAN